MSRILFPTRRKILNYVLLVLTLLLCFTVITTGYAQTAVQPETDKMKSIEIINPRPPFSLKLWLGKEGASNYQAGESIEILFKASQD